MCITTEEQIAESFAGASEIARKTPLTKYFGCEGDKLEYVYDYGDDWIHTVTLKKILDKKTCIPVCIKGKSDGPIEDIEEFYDCYAPRPFNIDEINKALAHLFAREK